MTLSSGKKSYDMIHGVHIEIDMKCRRWEELAYDKASNHLHQYQISRHNRKI
jgi:hypothetical protein